MQVDKVGKKEVQTIFQLYSQAQYGKNSTNLRQTTFTAGDCVFREERKRPCENKENRTNLHKWLWQQKKICATPRL